MTCMPPLPSRVAGPVSTRPASARRSAVRPTWPPKACPSAGTPPPRPRDHKDRLIVQQLYSQAQVTAGDVAEVIMFVFNRPRHLAINEVLLRPAGQL